MQRSLSRPDSPTFLAVAPPKMKRPLPTRVAVWYARSIGPLPSATRGSNQVCVSVSRTIGLSEKYSKTPAFLCCCPPWMRRFFSTRTAVWPPRAAGAFAPSATDVRSTAQAAPGSVMGFFFFSFVGGRIYN